MWTNFVERDRPQMTIWSMRVACWIPKATNTHTVCVWYSLLFHCNRGCKNAPEYCIIPRLPALFCLVSYIWTLANIWLLIGSVNIIDDESSYSSWILPRVFMFMDVILITFFLSQILWHAWEFCRFFRWHRATLYVQQGFAFSVTYHKYVSHVIVRKTVNLTMK